MDEVNLGDLVIRSCRQEDVAVLEQVSPSPGTSQFHLRRYERQLAGEVIYLTAWLEGSPVGNLCLILGGPDNPQARDGLPPGPELNAFDVIPLHRDRGIGSALIAEAERRALELGHSATVLGVEVNNDAAHRLYERLGYRDWPHGEMVDSYTWTDDAGHEHEQEVVVVWMEKRFHVQRRSNVAFTPAEIEYFTTQPLARLATVALDGQPDVVPVAFEFDGAAFWVGGSGESVLSSRKVRNVADGNRAVALVIDDMVSFDPFIARGIRVYGIADPPVERIGLVGPGFYIRITPRQSWSWNMDGLPAGDTWYSTRCALHEPPPTTPDGELPA